MMLFILQLVSCAVMTGLIWVIQILHYPAFALIREERFSEFHAFHSKNITYIVGPVMLIELATASLLVVKFSEQKFFWVNLFFLLVIWGCTALLSVPIHNDLALQQDQDLISKLVATNWPRTILWSLRLIALVIFFSQAMDVDSGNFIK
ncbi:MAG: hypothetical protein ACK5P5_03500 [Pseudobdellovibrionaceae bacterium]